MKNLLLKLTLIVVPVALLVIMVNYCVDPANMFRSREYVTGIVDILVKGNNVDNVKNYDERLLQEQMITRLKNTPDIIVLGSSRVMEIGNDIFPGKIVLNAGVSHANINDLIAIVGLMDSVGRLPSEIVINTDHFLVSEEATPEWQSIFPYYNYFVSRYIPGHKEKTATPFSNEMRRLSSLFSFSYFKESLLSLFNGDSKMYLDAGKSRPTGSGRLSDGTVCYPSQYMYPDTMRMATVARNTARRQGVSPPDPEKLRLLSLLIDFLKNKNVKLRFLMLPYHQDFYSLANKHHGGVLLQYDNLFRKLAAEKNIPVAGSFDPAAGGLGATHFYDMYHCNKEAIQKIINN